MSFYCIGNADSLFLNCTFQFEDRVEWKCHEYVLRSKDILLSKSREFKSVHTVKLIFEQCCQLKNISSIKIDGLKKVEFTTLLIHFKVGRGNSPEDSFILSTQTSLKDIFCKQK